MTGADKSRRVNVRNLVIKRAARVIIKNLTFDVYSGEVLGLIGPNGAGKSTLLSCLAGIEANFEGCINLDGKPLDKLTVQERARKIAWLEQLGAVHWPLTVERVVMLGRIPHLPRWSHATKADSLAVENALAQADCLNLRERRVTTLSGGERTRVLLARALATEPSLLLADEPVSSLDLRHQLQTMQLLRSYVSGKNAAVVVMHDLSLAARFCDRLLLLDAGQLIACGEIASVLTQQNIAEVYKVSVTSGCEQVPWVVPNQLL
jgi:iron complex transport system ATP-binding protein